MRICHILGLLCLTLSPVLTVPVEKPNQQGQDSVEQELIRHHHSTTTTSDDSSKADDNTYSAEKGNLDDDSSPVESIEDVPDENQNEGVAAYDEEDLYDITVGDVIRDVLMTLHDHPEIVKELIENEKDKIATRLAQEATDSVGTDLSDFQLPVQQDFQLPAQQLKNEPNRVEKKDGMSRQEQSADIISQVNGNQGNGLVTDDAEFNGFMNRKRADEVLDETFTSDSASSESSEQYDGYEKFIKPSGKPVNKYKMMYGGSSQEDSSSSGSGYRRHFRDSSESSDDSQSIKGYQSKYRLPIMNPIAMYHHYKNSGSSSQSSESRDSSSSDVTSEQTGSDAQTVESKSKTEESSSDNSEEQLAWLLQQMEANKKKEEVQQNM